MEQPINVSLETDTAMKSELSSMPVGRTYPERAILVYWGLSLILGGLALRGWLGIWNVPATLANRGLVAYLVLTFVLSQVLYVLVARHDGRPVRALPTLVFALGNGFFETLAFAFVYWLGATTGAWVAGLLAPAAANIAGFGLGVIFFMIYGGLIHALFWLHLLPPHLDDSPRSRSIRRYRPIAEVALVVGWSLCLWLYNDIWTVVTLHILVDIGLMLRVRPVIFYR